MVVLGEMAGDGWTAMISPWPYRKPMRSPCLRYDCCESRTPPYLPPDGLTV